MLSHQQQLFDWDWPFPDTLTDLQEEITLFDVAPHKKVCCAERDELETTVQAYPQPAGYLEKPQRLGDIARRRPPDAILWPSIKIRVKFACQEVVELTGWGGWESYYGRDLPV